MGKAHLCHVEVLHFESFLQLTVHPIPQLRIPHTHHDHRLHQVPHPRFPRLWPISQWPWCPGTRWWHCKKWVKLTNKQSVLRQETFKVCALVTSPFVRTSSSRIASWDFAELISTSKKWNYSSSTTQDICWKQWNFNDFAELQRWWHGLLRWGHQLSWTQRVGEKKD